MEMTVVSTLSSGDFGHDKSCDVHNQEYSTSSSSSSSLSITMSPSSNPAEQGSSSSLSSSDDDHYDSSPTQEPKSKKLRKKSLGLNYQPGEHAVVCGRGKEYSLSTGNCFLRSLVNHCLIPYSNASTKAEKTRIVTAIIKAVHALPTGIFIRYEKSQWWEVDDAFARDKVGSLFRDSLFTKYRSSTKAKMEKKRIRNNEASSSNKPCIVGSVLDKENADDEVSLMTPTTSSTYRQESSLQEQQQVLPVSIKDQSNVDPRLCNVISDDDGPVATTSLYSLCFSPKKYSQPDGAHIMPQLSQSSCRLFPPPLRRRQEETFTVPRQVSESSMTDCTPWTSVGEQNVEQVPLQFQSNECMTFEEQDTSLDDMISEMDELDSFLQNCF